MPEYYRAPLVERAEIVSWLLDLQARDWDKRGGFGYEAGPYQSGFTRGPWLFCFNVKLHRLDFSHAGLLEVARKAGHISAELALDQHWLSETRKRHDETSTDSLWEIGVEDSRRSFTGRGNGIPDDDGYAMLWDGTSVDTRFAFLGRSGGWLVLTGFEGHTLAGSGEEVLEGMSDECLRRLYVFLVMLQHDLGGDAPDRCVQEAAAFHFFHNVCHDICRTEDLAGAGI